MSFSTTPAVLVLEDGRTFHGSAYGDLGETTGEAVFVTAMSGYQETLTDPSYHRQIIIQAAPHIGNTGINRTMTNPPRSGPPATSSATPPGSHRTGGPKATSSIG